MKRFSLVIMWTYLVWKARTCSIVNILPVWPWIRQWGLKSHEGVLFEEAGHFSLSSISWDSEWSWTASFFAPYNTKCCSAFKSEQLLILCSPSQHTEYDHQEQVQLPYLLQRWRGCHPAFTKFALAKHGRSQTVSCADCFWQISWSWCGQMRITRCLMTQALQSHELKTAKMRLPYSLSLFFYARHPRSHRVISWRQQSWARWGCSAGPCAPSGWLPSCGLVLTAIQITSSLRYCGCEGSLV